MFYVESRDVEATEYDSLVFCYQRFSWDCGVACCCMIIRWAGNDIDYSLLLRYADLLCTHPCWTVDLFLLLREWKIKSDMYTCYIGLNPNHAMLPWYCTSVMDTSTVQQKFNLIFSLGITVYSTTLSILDLKRLLANGNVSLLVLVCSSSMLQDAGQRYQVIFPVNYNKNFLLLYACN